MRRTALPALVGCLAITACDRGDSGPIYPEGPRIPYLNLTINEHEGLVTLTGGTSAVLSWVTANDPTSCLAAGDWAGPRSPAGGVEPIDSLSGPETRRFVMTCSNATGTAVDSVTLVVEPSEPNIHWVYVVPAGGRNRELHTDGTLERMARINNEWLADETGYVFRNRVDDDGRIDIGFLQLNEPDSAVAAKGGSVLRYFVEEYLEALGADPSVRASAIPPMHELVLHSEGNGLALLVPRTGRSGTSGPTTRYFFFYEGTNSTDNCGGAIVGRTGAMYLRSVTDPALGRCDMSGFARSVRTMTYTEYATIHEIVHVLGYVESCSPHANNFHTTDFEDDLMWAGDTPWQLPPRVDIGRDDYFQAEVPGCDDLAESPFLIPPAANPDAATSPTTRAAARDRRRDGGRRSTPRPRLPRR